MKMEFSQAYMLAVADQLALVSTFLGGVSATILITIVIVNSSKKCVSFLVATSTLAACALLLSLISAWRLTIALHPDLPVDVAQSDILMLWRVMILAYIVGFASLIACIGVAGWLRSRKMGLLTTTLAGVTLVIFTLTSTFN